MSRSALMFALLASCASASSSMGYVSNLVRSIGLTEEALRDDLKRHFTSADFESFKGKYLATADVVREWALSSELRTFISDLMEVPYDLVEKEPPLTSEEVVQKVLHILSSQDDKTWARLVRLGTLDGFVVARIAHKAAKVYELCQEETDQYMSISNDKAVKRAIFEALSEDEESRQKLISGDITEAASLFNRCVSFGEEREARASRDDIDAVYGEMLPWILNVLSAIGIDALKLTESGFLFDALNHITSNFPIEQFDALDRRYAFHNLLASVLTELPSNVFKTGNVSDETYMPVVLERMAPVLGAGYSRSDADYKRLVFRKASLFIRAQRLNPLNVSEQHRKNLAVFRSLAQSNSKFFIQTDLNETIRLMRKIHAGGAPVAASDTAAATVIPVPCDSALLEQVKDRLNSMSIKGRISFNSSVGGFFPQPHAVIPSPAIAVAPLQPVERFVKDAGVQRVQSQDHLIDPYEPSTAEIALPIERSIGAEARRFKIELAVDAEERQLSFKPKMDVSIDAQSDSPASQWLTESQCSESAFKKHPMVTAVDQPTILPEGVQVDNSETASGITDFSGVVTTVMSESDLGFDMLSSDIGSSSNGNAPSVATAPVNASNPTLRAGDAPVQESQGLFARVRGWWRGE